MREHRYHIDIAHSAERIWALMQDYPRWSEYAPMVIRVDVIHPGDAGGNGLLRRVIYRMPFGRTGSAIELVTDVEPERGYTYTMVGREPDNDQSGHLRLEPLSDEETRLHFDERFHLTSVPWRWFEGPIYGFINRQNERSMKALGDYLSRHPEYPPA